MILTKDKLRKKLLDLVEETSKQDILVRIKMSLDDLELIDEADHLDKQDIFDDYNYVKKLIDEQKERK